MTVLAAGQGKRTLASKPTKEPPTQTLPLLKDPPAAAAGETARLTFHVSPLSNKGLLLQQTHDALKALLQVNHGARIVKLRAFVAGTGDSRRIPAIVSEVFTDKKLPLPAVSTILAGELPMEGAQVVIESVSEEKDKKPVNPNGLAFFPAQRGSVTKETDAKEAGAKEALDQLEAVAKNAHVAPAGILRVTCFLGSIEDASEAQAVAARMFPSAAKNFLQRLRIGSGASTACEGVGRRGETGGDSIQVTAEAALVSTPSLIFSGTQMAFHDQDADLRLAFQRLEKAIGSMGASYKDVVFSGFYPLTRAVEMKLPSLRMEFFQMSSPASTVIFEGLPSPDASLAIEVVLAGRN